MKPLLALLVCASPLLGFCQKVSWDKIRRADPDIVLHDGTRPPTQVLLLGTFHFAYPNQDAHKTDSSRFIDVLSPQRQRELEELAAVIARFRPTRVYIESARGAYHDSLYAEYAAGRYQAGRNEIFQVGYRVAKGAGLSRVYTVDASNLAYDYHTQLPMIDSLWTARVPVDSLRDQYWSRRYKKLYDSGDSLQTTLTMLENFLMMAEPKVLQRLHGAYLVSGFNSDDDDGPDALSIWWYNRNLRIFNNILQTRPGAEDRILVLFGNGHMPLLKHCFLSSPEFEVVELKSLLR
ncbi:MAG: hypothetical protein EOO12_15095 [Chitinophagaceae bacterium]|nr:MAG: hypothetical protein EOO12_15095 [Chitinophagaceae bacterium]